MTEETPIDQEEFDELEPGDTVQINGKTYRVEMDEFQGSKLLVNDGTQESLVEQLRTRMAMWILPSPREELVAEFRALEYHACIAPPDPASDAESSRLIRQLQERFGIDWSKKPEPYKVVQDDEE